MGVVAPNLGNSSSIQWPNTSTSTGPRSTCPPSKSNWALTALESRRRLQQQAEAEFEGMGHTFGEGRRFIDMRTFLSAMQLRELGATNSHIEQKLGLSTGLLNKLGNPGLLSHISAAE